MSGWYGVVSRWYGVLKPYLRWLGRGFIFLALLGLAILALAFAHTWALPQPDRARCFETFSGAQWPKWIGCAMAQHESLAGGLVGLWAALSAALLAYWSIQEQIEESRLTVRRQIEADHQEQGESTAKSIFRGYLRLAFENSDLAKPDYQKLAAEPDKLEKYSWFVAHLLWACEEILRYDKGEIWKENLQRNVDYHREYFINDSDFNERDFHLYEPSVQELVLNAMKPRTKNT